MTRRKVTLKFIADATARRACYIKRKKGLLKKMGEITTLCDIKACAIIYSPYDNQPVLWPDKEEASKVVDRYQNIPDMEQNRRKLDLEGIMKYMVDKTSNQVRRQRMNNREMELNQVINQCLTGSSNVENLAMNDLLDLNLFVGQKLLEINTRIRALTGKGKGPEEVGEPSLPPPPATLPPILPPPGLTPPNQLWTVNSSLGQNSGYVVVNMDNGAMQIQPGNMDVNMMAMNPSNQVAGFAGGLMDPSEQMEGFFGHNMPEALVNPTLNFGANHSMPKSFFP